MNVLEKILEEIEERRGSYFRYSKSKIGEKSEKEIAERITELWYVEEIIRSHMDEIPNCEGCSRRKWYQKGFEDGKKDNDWIPVEEKLPEEYERYKGRKVIDVLVTTTKGKVTKVQRQSHNGYWWWGRIYGEPTAWQPLPEPYIKNPK